MASSIFTITINNKQVEIRSLNISISGLDLAHPSPASVDVNLQAAGDDRLSLAAASVADPADAPLEADKKIKKKSFLNKFKPQGKSKKSQPAQSTHAAAAAPDAESAAAVTPAADDSRGDRSDGGRETAEAEPATPPVPPNLFLTLPQKQAAVSSVAAKNRPSQAPPASAPSGISNGEADGDEDDTDDEVDMTPVAGAAAAAASASNTVDSENADSASPAEPKKSKEKPGSSFLGMIRQGGKKAKPHRGSMDLLAGFNFPQDVPENVRTLFQMSDLPTKPKAVIYTSTAGSSAAVKKQKVMLAQMLTEKKFTVDGKSRSVWLDPAPGEAVEVWKEYLDDEGEFKRALGRLVGTEKYGYIVPDEVDQRKEFPTREERQAYLIAVQELGMFQNEYGEAADEDEQYA